MASLSESEKVLRQTGADNESITSDQAAEPRPSTTLLHPVTPEPEKKYYLEKFFPCDPRRWMHRYFMLVLMCFLSFGSYYVYDNPAALQRTIMNVMKIDTTQYVLLYSLYSWPNVVLSVFGGFLLDRVFGIRLGTVIFSILVCVGQFVFALGAFTNSFIVMATGRFVFGLGGENLAVAQNTYSVMWFKGKELNMVFGLLLSVSRIGSTVNMNINQKLYDSVFSFVTPNYVRLGYVLAVGFGFCVISLVCAMILGGFDWRAERITKRKESGTGEKISMLDVKDFPLRLWVIFIICVAYYVTVFPFIGLATVFLMDKYFVSSSHANLLNSLVYIISAVASPFLGILVDQTGFNLFWLNLGTILTLLAHAMFAFLGNEAFIAVLAMVIMGIAYSMLACALWPLVALIIPEHQLGTAYGIMQAIQNLGLAIITIVAGVIVDKSGYLILEVFFLANLCVALIAGIILYVLDAGSGSVLNMSAWGRRRLEKEKEEAKKAKEEEKVPFYDSSSSDTGPHGGRIQYTSPITPNSAFHIRNRMLSKLGAKLPDHIAKFNPLSTLFGLLVGHKITGVRMILEDGVAHSVDSSENAFKAAAMGAMRAYFKKGSPIILEPVMAVEVVAPMEFQGTVIGGINKKRGVINGTDSSEGYFTIFCEVPLNEMFGYSTELRSITQGKGEFTMEYHHYQPVMPQLQAEMIDDFETERLKKQKTG